MNTSLAAEYLKILPAEDLAVSRGLKRNEALQHFFKIHLLFSGMAGAILGQISRDGRSPMNIKSPQRGPTFGGLR